MDEVVEVIWALGHPNIQALHPTTLMITKDRHLSKKGDCVVAVAADKGLTELEESFKSSLKKPNAQLNIQIDSNDVKEQICAHGSPKFILSSTSDLVVRKSAFICNRTLAILSDKASIDLSRQLIEKLKDPNQKVKITLTVKTL